MAREIRITVDDDEVFERMKARKRELDLSWEEVLHRGLRRNEQANTDPADPDPHRHQRYPNTGPRDPVSDPSGFAEDLKRQIQGQVRDSLLASLEGTVDDVPGRDPLQSEVSTLEAAEDATLVFGFLGEAARDPARQVPLRITLEASADGLGVDVVAVRQGKGVSDANAFEPGDRRRIVERLAAGDPATLRLGSGDEEYAVAPVLSWSRVDGTPTVTDVAIEEVLFDAE